MPAEGGYDAKVSAAQRLYRALAAGDRATLAALLHPEFIGHATEGLPLDMGGQHVGPEEMAAKLWWRIGRHYRVEAQVDEMSGLDDGRLFVAGHYRGEARESGNKLDAAFIHVLGFAEDGRIASLDQLTDSAAWIEALGVGAPVEALGVRVPIEALGPSAPVEALGANAPLQTIDYSVVDGVATVCLNRPEARNAIDMRMALETLEVARRIAADSSVRAVLICGNGPALTVGGDIDYFSVSAPEEFAGLVGAMTPPFHEAFEILGGIDAPIVTAAHGVVAGGGLGYVYAADLVLAAEGTRFVTAFAALGLSGDGGGTWHLPRLIGARRAAQAYLRNTPITTAEALDWGLINEIVPAPELRARASALASELAHGPTRAFARIRALMAQSWNNDLSTQLRAEIEALKATGATADAQSAIQSFAAKRTPRFTGS